MEGAVVLSQTVFAEKRPERGRERTVAGAVVLSQTVFAEKRPESGRERTVASAAVLSGALEPFPARFLVFLSSSEAFII